MAVIYERKAGWCNDCSCLVLDESVILAITHAGVIFQPFINLIDGEVTLPTSLRSISKIDLVDWIYLICRLQKIILLRL